MNSGRFRAGLRAAALSAALIAAPSATSFGQSARSVPSQAIVKFAPGLVATEAANMRSEVGARVIKRLDLIGAELWQLDGMSTAAAIAHFRGDSRLRYIEPNYRVRALATRPNDPSFGQLWGLDNRGQTGGRSDADIDAPEAWDVATGTDVLVSVIDTGVDWGHPDLAANIFRNAGEIPNNQQDDDGNGFVDDVRGWDFVNNDNDPNDDNQHGTHCAGTIGAVGNNGTGVAGVAWRVQILPIKFLDAFGSGTLDGAVAAIDYSLRMRARVSSNSWGCLGCDSQALRDAVQATQTAGQLFIAAAGNDNNNNDGATKNNPSSYEFESIVAVAATDHNDARASFSNFGRTSVDLGAPGVNILSTVPGGGYGSLSGTSMATPHVAGAVAMIWGRNNTLSAAQVKGILLANVDPVTSLRNITVTGGRLNLERAMAAVTPPPVGALAVVNAASYNTSGDDPPQRTDGVAPSALVSGFGVNLAPQPTSATSPCQTTLADRRVLVRDAAGVERASCVLWIGPQQVNFQIPPDTAFAAGGAAARSRLLEASTGREIAAGDTRIYQLSPGVFSFDASGRGLAAANVLRVRGDQQTYEPINQPIDLGPESDTVFLILYATGLRQLPNRDAVTVTIGGFAGEVTFAGEQGQFTGVEQINVRLPRALASVHGTVDVLVQVQGAQPGLANRVTVTMR